MARIAYCLAVVCVFLLNRVRGAYGPEKLYLTIYYESRCSDSKNFVLDQLVPTVEQLQDYLMLKFIPFGKADSIDNGIGGFTCQHGPPECLGNMVQDCTLYLMQDRPYTDMVDYVACEMKKKAGSRNSTKCVEEANISAREVRNCLASGLGTALQLESEYLTKLIRPKFIATVTVDGIFDQQFQDYSQENLMGSLCTILGDIPPCINYYNNIAMAHILT